MVIRPLNPRAVITNYFTAVNRYVPPSDFSYGTLVGNNVYVLWAGTLGPVTFTLSEFLALVNSEVSGAAESY